MVAAEGGFEPVVGVVSAPALGRRWWAAKGGGAYTGRSLSSATRLRVSRVSQIRDSSFAYSSLTGWEEQGRLDGFLDLSRAVWRTRGYGDFWPYMMVAEGSVDMCAEPELSLWDMAAPAVVVQEAGGRFTGLDGRPGPHGGNAAASNGVLHDELLGYLNQRY
jgi:histidinol-phosphatase